MTTPKTRNFRRIDCPSCGCNLPSSNFRGRSIKAATCRGCEDSHPKLRWCLDCGDWISESDFYWDKATERHRGSRCKPCVVHRSHGVTRKHMVELTGRATPSCSACGDTDRLSIDHDHAHCEGEAGCQHCVRGYLCRACNVAEGLLKTVERTAALLDYMRTARLTADDLAALPAPRVGRRARPSRKSAAQPHAFYRYRLDVG